MCSIQAGIYDETAVIMDDDLVLPNTFFMMSVKPRESSKRTIRNVAPKERTLSKTPVSYTMVEICNSG